MKIKVLLCNCKGLCDSFKETDMNTLPFQVESELSVEYTIVHPQLCGQGGNLVLTEALRSTDPETYILVGACAPAAQEKLFKKILRTTGFDDRRFVPLDIRSTSNEGVLDRLRGTVEIILKQAHEAKTPAAVA
jgi:heterodisulfide reductase subunit A-like polyferredoxin